MIPSNLIRIGDLGRARFKGYEYRIAKSSDSVRLVLERQVSVEVSTSDETLAGPAEAARVLRQKLGTNVDALVAGSAFRETGPYRAYGQDVQASLGAELSVLTEEDEAKYFMSALRGQGHMESALAVDIGGGSVQVSWDGHSVHSFSRPYGTFELSERYGFNRSSSDEQFQQVGARLKADFTASLPAGFVASTLFVGSSRMATTFSTVATATEEVSIGEEYPIDWLSESIRFLRGASESRLEELFPGDLRFALGLAPAMLVAQALGSAAGCTSVRGTNACVAEGVATTIALPGAVTE